MRHSSPYNIQWDFELRAVVDLKLLVTPYSDNNIIFYKLLVLASIYRVPMVGFYLDLGSV